MDNAKFRKRARVLDNKIEQDIQETSMLQSEQGAPEYELEQVMTKLTEARLWLNYLLGKR